MSPSGPQVAPPAARTRQDADPEPRPAALRGKRVLVVEDEPLLATDLAEELSELGAEVVGPVNSVRDALTLITADGTLNAAVLDIGLLDGQAYAVADALHGRGVPFVFLTGYDAEGIPEAYRDTPRCEKPADMRVIARLVEREA